MTDRELLELASKAAGIEHGAARLECGLSLTERDGRHRSLPRWNPLDDDGDALRLAVALWIDFRVIYGMAYAGKQNNFWSSEKLNDDPNAATRRAIVRSAAQIGMGMS